MYRHILVISAVCAAPATSQAGDEISLKPRVAPSTVVRFASDGEAVEGGVDVQVLPHSEAKKEQERRERWSSLDEQIHEARTNLEEAAKKSERALGLVNSAQCNAVDAREVLAINLAVADLRDLQKKLDSVDTALDESRKHHRVLVSWGLVVRHEDDSSEAANMKPPEQAAPSLKTLTDALEKFVFTALEKASSADECMRALKELPELVRKELATRTEANDKLAADYAAYHRPAKQVTRESFLGGNIIVRATGQRDKDLGISTFSRESGKFGLKSELALQYGKAGADPLAFGLRRGGSGGFGLMRFWRIALTGEWKAERFKFQPVGEKDETKKFHHDWKLGVALSLFSGIGKAKSTPDVGEAVVSSEGARTNVSITNTKIWLWGPQVRVNYGRAWNPMKATSVTVLPEPYTPGPVAGELRVVEGPKVSPELNVLIAVPFQPARTFGGTGFAFGPAIQIKTVGVETAWRPWGKAWSVRPEFWLYWHVAEDEKTSSIARLGVAPFVDVRSMTGDKGVVRETIVGALLELRTGTNTLRLMY